MNYESYRIFFAVGKHKNITRAAEELFSSQPAVTRAIKNMETEFGCQLFVRSKTGVEFTKEGKKLYELIKVPCNLLMRADQELHQSAYWNSETIHIGTTDMALRCFLFDFLETFRGKCGNNINFKICTGSSSKMISRLRNGEIDLVVNTTPFFNAHPLSVTPVCKITDILVGGRIYQDLQGKQLSLRDLQNYPFILLSSDMQYRQFCDAFFDKSGVQIEPALEVDSSGLIVPMVAYNWGLAFVPEEMARKELDCGSIVKIDLAETIPLRSIVLVTDPQRPLSKAAQRMCEMVLGR